MYEYECKDCGFHFDLLRSMNQANTGIVCPSCGSEQTERMLSVFAAVNKESSSAATSSMADMGGSCCSGGSCGCSFN
jgi:putative FmdB family regulatory protein